MSSSIFWQHSTLPIANSLTRLQPRRALQVSAKNLYRDSDKIVRMVDSHFSINSIHYLKKGSVLERIDNFMDTKTRSLRILMLPWLAHGHISPFLELARTLAKRNFYIYFCSTPINLVSLKQNLSEKDSISIKLVELHLPSLPELPPRYHTTNGLPPHLMVTLKEAMDMAKPSFHKLLITLNPDLVLYDFLQPWVPKLAAAQNIPAVLFFTIAAASCSYFLHHFLLGHNSEYPFPAMYYRDHEMGKLQSLVDATANGIKDFERILDCCRSSTDMILIKTWREIEGKYIDYLTSLCQKKIVPVGPLVQAAPAIQDDQTKIIDWLNRKEQASTVFASFGSEYFLSKQEMKEIALGLELSNANFIWVVRFHKGEETRLEDVLPKGYLKRVGERALLLEGWAPQGRILGHSSIGGFVSHCGWSSVMESIKFSVPIIPLPMHLDQHLNARLVEELGVGKEAQRNKRGDIEREDLSKVIKEVLEQEVSEKFKKKAQELNGKLEANGEKEIDDMVNEILKVCKRIERFNSLDTLKVRINR